MSQIVPLDSAVLRAIVERSELENQPLAIQGQQQIAEARQTINAQTRRLHAAMEEYAFLQRQIDEAQSHRQQLIATHQHTIDAKKNQIETQESLIEIERAKVKELEFTKQAAITALKAIHANPRSVIAAEGAIHKFHEEKAGYRP